VLKQSKATFYMHKTPAAVTYYYIWFHNVTVNQLELSTTTGARLCTQNVA